jgi:hypothetical protein
MTLAMAARHSLRFWQARRYVPGFGIVTDNLAEVERIAEALLRCLSSGQRRTLMCRMARTLAQSQRDRVAAQRQLDSG